MATVYFAQDLTNYLTAFFTATTKTQHQRDEAQHRRDWAPLQSHQMPILSGQPSRVPVLPKSLPSLPPPPPPSPPPLPPPPKPSIEETAVIVTSSADLTRTRAAPMATLRKLHSHHTRPHKKTHIQTEGVRETRGGRGGEGRSRSQENTCLACTKGGCEVGLALFSLSSNSNTCV